MNEWLTVALEEYKSLRTESLESVKNQHAILNYAILIFGGLTAVAASTWKDLPVISAVVLLLVLPSTASTVLVIWAVEVARVYRVGVIPAFARV